jgi:hypothetical protein
LRTTTCPSDLLEALDLLRVLKTVRAAVKEHLRALEAGAGPGPAEVALPASLHRNGSCYACGGSRWWLSVHGALVCATCHPPAVPELVARWVEAQEAAAFKKAARAPGGAAEYSARNIGAGEGRRCKDDATRARKR